MDKENRGHTTAALQALLVTFLWSSSWVLIKIGLVDIPALPFAGLRYSLAFFCLLPFAVRSGQLKALRHLPGAAWARLVLLGLLFYAVTQGAQFVSLAYLPALTTSLILSFTTILVALLGMVLLGERPGALQWGGLVLYLVGVAVYFAPTLLPGGATPGPMAQGEAASRGQIIGLAVAIGGMVANAFSSILGRHVNRDGGLSPLAVTVVTMGIGAGVLLVGGVAAQGLPRLSIVHWAIVAWLAVVNTAFAFTLWNRTLRTLPAMESSILNNTMLFQIALLAWLFLGEDLGWYQVGGMVLAAAGTLVVQVRRRGGEAAATAPLRTAAQRDEGER
ncbi:MAG TPA: DMT family transporter [Anaerolineae bacterium]|nr:DMT family transporter [Anaerolineae bacterium]